MVPHDSFSYSLKIINPENKGGYIVEEWKDRKFFTQTELEMKLSTQFKKYIQTQVFNLGICLLAMALRESRLL